MLCPACHAENDDGAESCFTCGKALFALTQGVLLASRYEVLRPLGKGGMGRVYKAYDRVLEETVAIKVLRVELTRDPEMARRFRSEIKLARKVSHANVCRIHDYGEDGGLLYISMELIEGTNLKDVLAGDRALSVARAFEMVLQIARGLAAVHEHGIVHRDFKASNIMVDQKGVVKLMDFGIAKDIASDTSGVTSSGQVIGTPEYMSPEQASGEKVDLRADIYSLGCVVFEVFTGDAPFRGDTPLQTLYKHIHESAPLDSERARAIPEPLRPVLRRALAKQPGERFANAAELTEALGAARAALAPETAALLLREIAPHRPPQPTTTLGAARRFPAQQRRPRAWLASAAGAGLLALGLAVALWLRPGPGAPSPSAPPSVAEAPPATLSREPSATAAPVPLPVPVSTPLARGASATPPPATTVPAKLEAARPRDTPPASAPRAEPSGLEAGSLALLVVPASEVTIDGATIGVVSLRDVPLAAGPHVVRILHPDYEPLQRKLTIRPGIAQKLVIDLSEKGIRKTR